MKTRYYDLDEIIKVDKGDLIVIASRPAMGKSTFVLNILSHLTLKEEKNVLFFSLEDSKESIINKLIISNSIDTIKVAWMPEYYMFGNTIVVEEDTNGK